MALWEQTKDLTYITVESGRAVGRSLQWHVTAVVPGWDGCPRSVLLWWEVGGQQGLGLSWLVPFRAGLRPGQVGRQQSRAIPFKAGRHTLLEPSEVPPVLALRASAVSLSVALKGADHTTGPRHLVACLGS